MHTHNSNLVCFRGSPQTMRQQTCAHNIKTNIIKQRSEAGGQSCLYFQGRHSCRQQGGRRAPYTSGRVLGRKMFADPKNCVPQGCITPTLISKFRGEKLVSPAWRQGCESEAWGSTWPERGRDEGGPRLGEAGLRLD